jgi:hypothetical protein
MKEFFHNARGAVTDLFSQINSVATQGNAVVGSDFIGPLTTAQQAQRAYGAELYGLKNNLTGHYASRYRVQSDYTASGLFKSSEFESMGSHVGGTLKTQAALAVGGALAGAGAYASLYLGFSPFLIPGALGVGGLAVIGGLAGGKALISGAARVAGTAPIRALGGLAGVANGVLHTGLAAERVARTVLTGSPLNILGTFGDQGKRTGLEQAIDAYLPNFRNMPHTDIRKYAPNPTIVKRIIAGRAVKSLYSGLSELINPALPNPTIFYDGVNVRRKSDMGVHAGYGQQLLESSNGMNASLMRAAVHML